jgi:membrane-bound metal-dependent hydrolase YbcI (DUF457 family)
MASPLGHSLMGVVIYVATVKSSDWLKRWGWLFLLVLFSMAADLDYLPAAFGRLDLADQFHRKFTHTLIFAVSAVAIYIAAAGIVKRKVMWKAAMILFAALMIHLAIDIVSLDEKEPQGIEPFKPFSDVNLYSPVIIFPSVMKGTYGKIISLHNVKVALFEIAYFGALIIFAGGISVLIEYKRTKNGNLQ